jgi:short-subunit dehydrogenase
VAREYAELGYELGLVGRDPRRLAAATDAFPGRAVMTHAADLADPNCGAAISDWVAGAGRSVDVLVNAAGHFAPELYATSNWGQDAAFLQTMLTTPCELVRVFLPGMLGRGRGEILNVSSLLGLLPGVSSHSLYCACKAFLIKFSQAIHLETRGTGVNVTALCPGLTDTDFFSRGGTRQRYRAATPAWLWQTPDVVAKAGVAAVRTNRAVCVPGLANKAIAGLARGLPDGIALAVAARVAPRFR